MLERSIMFKEWKELQTIFIGKKDSDKVRPMTMSSCVGKVFERMINKRLIWLAEKKGWFDCFQNGFRRGRSCVDNISRLVTDIDLSKESNENLLVAFFRREVVL